MADIHARNVGDQVAQELTVPVISMAYRQGCSAWLPSGYLRLVWKPILSKKWHYINALSRFV
jgi:hypothetical protein